MGAFKVLLEYLNVHPQLPGGTPLTVRATSRVRKLSTRTEEVTALRLMVGCSGEAPCHAVCATLGKNRGGRAPSKRRKVFRSC